MHQKGFINIVPIVLVVILAGVVGYFALRKPTPELTIPSTNQQPPKQVSNQTPKPLPDSKVETSDIATEKKETTNWKTYRNDKYWFEFKYPNNMGELIIVNDGGDAKEGWQSANGQLGVQVKSLPSNFKFVERKEDVGIYIDCKSSFGLKYCIEGFGDEGGYRSDQVEIYNFDRRILVYINHEIRTDADVYLLDKIISTFKFTK